MPGDTRAAYEHGGQARQILNDAEDDLRDWRPSSEPLGAEEVSSPTKTTSKEESLQEPLQEEPAMESTAEAAGALPGEEGTRTTEVAG